MLNKYIDYPSQRTFCSANIELTLRGQNMKLILIYVLIFLCIGLPPSHSQRASKPNILKATVIIDPANKMKVRGQATIAFGRGRNFPRPENQFQKALINISEQINNETGVFINEYTKLPLSSGYLHDIPFVILALEDSFNLTLDETDNLRRYLKNGGFIYCENTLATVRNSPVEQSFKKMIAETLGNNASFESIEKAHPVFHSFYDFPEGAPIIRENSVINSSQLKSVVYDGRIVAIYSNRPYTSLWNKPEKNTLSLKLAVNMIIFALTRASANTIRK